MSIGILILVLAIVPALWKKSGVFTILWILGSAFLAFEYLEVLYSRAVHDYIVAMPLPVGDVSVALNKLSAFFGVIFALGLPIGLLYGHYYLKEHPGTGLRSHLFWLGIMGLSMHCLLWVRHSLIFLMFWELMSLSSFFCIVFSKRENLKAGLNYIVTMQVGAAFLIAGFALAYLQSGTFNFSGFEEMNPIPMYLILIGFAFKAGVFPVASWLPQAHPVAPSHVSGIMSSMLVNTGFYGILLIVSANRFSLSEIGVMSLVFTVSAFWAVSHLLNERNLKRALAFSTVENVGIAGMGLCIGLLGIHAHLPNMAVLGFAGAFLHIFFHSLFKAQLFYSSGNILLATGTLDIDEMGGLAKLMPHTAAMTLLGVLAISAIPLTNGFISEFSIFKATLEASDAVMLTHLVPSMMILGALAFISALAMIAFFRIYTIVFQGTARSPKAEQVIEHKPGIRIPIFILSFGILLTGIFPVVALRFVKPLLRWFDLDMRLFAEFQELSWQISYVYLVLIGIFILLYTLRRLVVTEKSAATWACAYPKVNKRMQSSSITFVQPLAYFLKPFMIKKSLVVKSIGPFPEQIEYSEEHPDAVWELFVLPLSRRISSFLRFFSGIHNGKTNSYIAWALVFLVLMLAWVVGFR
jgi:formate hydrogenlyase subunit 3/multisubunit Na+/H+ antiporter MnhD subunit